MNRRQTFNSKGLCTTCGKVSVHDFKTCAKCRDKTKSVLQELRKHRVSMGLCRYCGKEPHQDHSTSCVSCEEKYRIGPTHRQALYQRLKLEAMNAYGGTLCNCCKQSFDPIFLAIDHVNNDGNKTRKQQTGYCGIYGWLRKNNFPEGFQVLCHNCNWAKHANGGTCPHQDITYSMKAGS